MLFMDFLDKGYCGPYQYGKVVMVHVLSHTPVLWAARLMVASEEGMELCRVTTTAWGRSVVRLHREQHTEIPGTLLPFPAVTFLSLLPMAARAWPKPGTSTWAG